MPRPPLRLPLAAAALAAALAPVAPAAADPVPYPPPPMHLGQCTLWWYPVPIFSDEVPVTPYVPRCIW
ncbi:MAG TPA: hypothetical protein VF519_05650 [Mycobacteriales bacterium]|jgi:hypothetical protein